MSDRFGVERLVASVFAVAFGVIGVIGIARSWTTAGWLVLLGLCMACVGFAVFAPRATGIEVAVTPKGVTVKTSLAAAVVGQLDGFASAAATYTFIHAQLADDQASHAVKIALQDDLVAAAVELAAVGRITQSEVTAAARSGTQAERPLAFGILTARSRWAGGELLVQGIAESESGNEQYHALRAANAGWTTLTPDERRAVQNAARTAPWIEDDADRAAEAERLLARSPAG